MLSVRPAADGVKLSFEMEMLEPSERPTAEQILALERALEQTAESPWDRGCIEPVLRGWVHSLILKEFTNPLTRSQLQLTAYLGWSTRLLYFFADGPGEVWWEPSEQ